MNNLNIINNYVTYSVLFCGLYARTNVYIINKEIQRVYNAAPKFYFLFSTVHTTSFGLS